MDGASVGGVAPWRTPDAYSYLLHVERATFAWEWLRRTAQYRHLWDLYGTDPLDARDRAAREVGLASLIDPARGGDEARPIWLAACDWRVVAADVADEDAPRTERLDVRLFRGRAEVAVDAQGVEHWRFGDAARAVRIDLMSGTLLGAPTLLAYRLSGLARLLPKLGALALLASGVRGQRAAFARNSEARRRRRWILELRVSDALADGASQHEIARELFGMIVPARAWRRGDESYRLRVQRLVRAVRARLADPIAMTWFQ